MSSATAMTEKKLKSAAKRLPLELESAGVDVSDLGYAKALDILSKSIFGKPYTEVKATLLNQDAEATDTAEAPFHAVVEIEHCGNILLAVNGVYVTATNPGTDMEIPYHALSARAADEAARYGVGVRNADLTGLCLEAESDDEIVEMAEKMGFFQRDGSIFEELEEAGVMLVNGFSNEIGLHLNWRELVEQSDFPEGQVIWLVRTYPNGFDNPDIYEFTFGDLCSARKNGDHWLVPEMLNADYDSTPTHRIALR